MTKPQIYYFIKDNYGIEYSLRQIDRIIKKKLNCGYSKPYVIYNESPDDAEEQVLDTFNDIDLNECIFGYQDESHCNINENKMRIYYPLERRNIRYNSRKRITTSIMGYQSVNGQLILYFPKRSVTYYFMNFLLRVLIANIDNPNIVSRLIDIINDDYHSEESTISYLKERNSEEQMNQFKNNYIEYMRYTNGKEPTPQQIERKIKSYKKKINPKDKTLF